MFNRGIVDIFNCITQPNGNKFYLLEADEYKKLFSLDYEAVKLSLLHNSMLYIGTIKDGKFIANYKNIDEAHKIVVFV